ncbi:MAG: CAP domain-containing protein [Corynebacterium sp.]|nr:CAP domain-containing protein [Corynebacterium sp.]
MKAIVASFIAANAFGSSFLGSSADNEPAQVYTEYRAEQSTPAENTTEPNQPADTTQPTQSAQPTQPTQPTEPTQLAASTVDVNARIETLTTEQLVQGITQEINRVRAANGLSTLTVVETTQKNAQAWAGRAARTNSTAHSTAGTSARQQNSSEIIAQNYKTQTIKDIMDSWLNSDQHRPLLLATNIDRFGVGVATNANGFTYSVVQFLKK